MPVNYKNGKIYKLWSVDNDLVYVGSTTQPLSKRLGEHKGKYNTTNSQILFANSNDVKIELLEQIECDNIEQLHRLEGEYIRRLDCVNKRIAGRTYKEWCEDNTEHLKEQRKEYIEKNKEQKKEKNEKNKEQHKEKMKEWYDKNKEKKKEQIKEWYEVNKEKILEQRKKHYEDNKEQKKEYYKKKKEKLSFADRTSTALPVNSTSDVGIVTATS